jgi:hypothetical protein
MTWKPNPNPKAPDFAPGNTMSVTHGANSPRAVEARAEIVRQELFTICPWLDAGQDVIAVARFLRAEARALMLHESIMEISERAGAAKVPVRQWEQATAADRLAAQLGNVLGLDPTGRARLKQTVVSTEHTLADLMAQGRTIRKAAEARHAAEAAQLPPAPAQLPATPTEGES